MLTCFRRATRSSVTSGWFANGKIKTDLRSVQNKIKEDYKRGVIRTKRLRRDSDETDVNITASIGHLTVQQCTAAKSLKFVNVPTTSTSSDFPEKQDDFPTLSISEGYGGYSISVNKMDIPQTPSKEGFFFSPLPPWNVTRVQSAKWKCALIGLRKNPLVSADVCWGGRIAWWAKRTSA